MKRVDFLYMIGSLLQFANDECINVICAAFYRTEAEQKKLFDQGLSKCDGVNIRSPHQDWLAMDFYIVKNDELVLDRVQEYDMLGNRWEDIGGVWGGRFASLNDIYHFERGQRNDA